MKKIMTEWKRWLFETAPTEKDLSQQPKPEGASAHHRALPDFYRGSFINGLKVGLKNYFTNGNVVTLSKFFQEVNNSEDPRLKPQVAKTLISLHYLYKNKDRYGGLYNVNPGTVHAPGAQGGFIFDAQPIIKQNDPAKAVEPIVKMLGNTKIVKDYFRSGKVPPSTEMDYVLNNLISPPPASEKRPRLSRMAANISSFYKNPPKEE